MLVEFPVPVRSIRTNLNSLSKKVSSNCGTSVGFEHEDGCDNEACTDCGLQKISCGCEDVNSRERWTGIPRLRMLQICEEQDLYTTWSDGGWVPAQKDDPNSMHDLNRAAAVLMREKNNV